MPSTTIPTPGTLPKLRRDTLGGPAGILDRNNRGEDTLEECEERLVTLGLLRDSDEVTSLERDWEIGTPSDVDRTDGVLTWTELRVWDIDIRRWSIGFGMRRVATPHHKRLSETTVWSEEGQLQSRSYDLRLVKS